METIKQTKTVTKTIETVTTITTVEVIREIKVITTEEPIEELIDQQEEVVVTPEIVKEQTKPIEVEDLTDKMTDPRHLRFEEENAEEANQVSTAAAYTLLYWDTELKSRRKDKDGFVGKQVRYLEFKKITLTPLWIDVDKYDSILDVVKGNYNLKPEFKARLQQYIKDNVTERPSEWGGFISTCKPYAKVNDQDFEFFKSVGIDRKIKL